MKIRHVAYLLTILLFLASGIACTGAKESKTSVTIVISQQQMDVIKSLPEDVVCVTSASNPITSLVGLGNDEFASWTTSFNIPQKLMAAFGREDTPVGLKIMAAGHENADFNKNKKLRLFITQEPNVEQLLNRGGVRIEFKTE